MMAWFAAMGFACTGGEGGIIISGPGPGSDEPPFVPPTGGGNTFGGACEPLVSCESLGATCGDVLDNCGNPLNCDDNEQNGAETDVDCGGGGNCERLCQNGQMCEVAEDCENEFCTDNVCCDEECDAVCMTCEFGSCQPIQQNEEDPGACETTQACDGQGECKLVAGETCADNDACVSGFCDLTNMVCN